MKKAVILVATLLLTTVLTPEAWAVKTYPYCVEGINISIPETYSVLTREMELDDETMCFMEEKNIYLDAKNEEGNRAIRITIKDLEIKDPLLLDDEGIKEWIPYFEEQSKEIGDTVEESEIYHHNQTGFHKMHLYFTNPYGVHNIIQYNTIIYKKWICIEMNFGSDPVSPEQEAESEEIIDSIYILRRFLKEPAGHTDAYQYVDPTTRAEFIVPENWSIELSGKNEYPHTIIYLNSNPKVFVMYGVMDLWEEVPQGQRAGRTRASMGNPLFGPEGLAYKMGILSNAVSRKRYGEMEYAVGKRVERRPNGYGRMEIVGHTTVIAGFDNGYAYYFFFPGWKDHENYKDLEAIVSSMKYPEASDDGTDSVIWVGIFLAAVLVMLSVITVMGVSAKARKRRETEEQYGGLEDTREPAEPGRAGRPKNCRFCGAKLPKKGAFCPECGTRIEE